MNRRLYLLCLLLATGCVEPTPLDNENFNLWCGDELCGWTTDKGTIRRVGTWDPMDYGVALVGTPSAISQKADLSLLPGPCMRFSILGSVQAEAEVRLELDFSDDGTVDYTEGVPSTDWHRIDLLVKLPTQPYSSMKVSLDKQGKGTAIFANLALASANKCQGDPIHLEHLPIGDLCSDGADCESGHCSPPSLAATAGSGPQTCGECEADSDCTNGLVCGAAKGAFSGFATLECLSPGETSTGDICNRDDQCGSGICENAFCSECRKDTDCAGGEVCSYRSGAAASSCVKRGSVENGTLCTTDAECASGSCCIICNSNRSCTSGGP